MGLCYSLRKKQHLLLLNISLYLFGMNVYGQEPKSTSVELYIGVINSNYDITFTLTSVNEVWATNTWGENFLLSDQYNNSQWTADYTKIDNDDWGGWDFVTSHTQSSEIPVYAYGLYKFSRNDYVYFYIDYRDDRYGNYSAFGDPLGHAIDLWIKYDNFLSEFYYSTDGYVPWIRINNGTTLSIWEIKQMGEPTRARFQPTNPTGLTVTKVNNHPKLTWTPSSAPSSGAKYHVYRAADLTFHCIASYLDTNTYTDDDVTFNKFGDTYHYKVRAVSGDSAILSPGYSNVVSFLGDGPIEKKIVPKPVNEQPDIISVKVFPNPFNNTVSINLCTPSDELTEIAIYDLRGRIIKAFHPTPDSYYFDTI